MNVAAGKGSCITVTVGKGNTLLSLLRKGEQITVGVGKGNTLLSLFGRGNIFLFGIVCPYLQSA